jgi:hypothetical protein
VKPELSASSLTAAVAVARNLLVVIASQESLLALLLHPDVIGLS